MSREAELMRRRSVLSEAKKALLTERLQHSFQQETPYPALSKRTPQQKNLLSFAQQRLWFLDQFASGNPFYTIPLLIELDGVLNIQLLARCLQELMERHEALRTNFVMDKDEPVQVITASSRLSLPVIDLRKLSEQQQQQTAHDLTHQEVHHAFNLTYEPLVRSTLLCLGPQQHMLLLTIHHIISDGWSLAILYSELTALYAAFLRGQTAPVSPLSLQYADYALWQRSQFQDDGLQMQLAYWRQQLAHLTDLKMPTDFPRPPVQTFHGATVAFALPIDLVQKINLFCQQKGITRFIFLLAAFQTLLARYTGQDDIAVGTPISGRTRVELEGLVGLFVNTLVIRTNIADNPQVDEMLERVRDGVAAAFNNQDVPFERLVEELQPERNMNQAPLVQTLFTMKVPVDTVRHVGRLSLRVQELESATSRFDLMLTMSEEQGGIVGQFAYNTDLFAESTMGWMVNVYETLLAAFVSTAEQHLRTMPLLGEAQRRKILVEWNATQETEKQPTWYLPDLFERQVEQTPHAVALVCEDHFLTYAALNLHANHVAQSLQRLGVTAGKRVGVCLERSFTALIGLLGILKAGGAYVPLDPAYPQERLAFMAESAAITVLLTCENLRGQVPSGSMQVIYLDTDASLLATESAANPQRSVRGEHLAYVIFTSGTTGQPKGAGVYHRGLLNLLSWYISEFNLTGRDQTVVITSLSFDLTQKNLFAPLLVGGSVCLHASPYHDVPSLQRLIAERGISLLNCTPSMFYPFLDEEDRLHLLASLRYLFLGGEPIALRRLRYWLERPDCHAEVVNTYGPTECSDVVAFYRLKQPQDFLEAVLPLGRPIANTQLLILDQSLQLVPPVVPGEVYIAGLCVGAGYVNDELLTSAKFIPNPFPEIPGTILYKTGDLARYRPDGLLEFQGRSDHQVKIRGFRIELGEIEAVLLQQKNVHQCVVHIWSNEAEEKYLVAYVSGNQVPSSVELSHYLRAHLPDYMVPSFFVNLEQFPLTPSGKVDRRSLPLPGHSESALVERRKAARTPVEEVVVGVYREMLNVEQVGFYDNFFELGGHSLLATRVVARLGRLLHVEVPLRILFESPIVADFARRIEQAMRGEQDTTHQPLMPVERTQNLPLSFAQQRIWFLHQLASSVSTYALPLAIRIQGPLESAVLEQCIQAIVQRHESLRTTFAHSTRQPVQIVHETMPVALEIVELSHELKQHSTPYILSEIMKRMEQPFDLQGGPLLRATLFRMQPTEHIFFLVFHHIIFDGWSIGVLLYELSILYEAFMQENGPILPPLPIQYVDFACWQREWLQGEVVAKQVTYWKEQLRGARAVDLSCIARPGASNSTDRGAGSTFTVSKQLAQDLMALSRREEVTLFMTVLTAFQLLLSRLTGQDDIVVGTDIANRTREETEHLIGFFVNLLALRTQFQALETFRVLLKRVRTTVLNAYAHQDLPFEKVVDALQLERSGGQTPLISVLFVWQNIPLPALRFHGLELSLLEEENAVRTSKFDLALFMMERDGILTGVIDYRTDLFEHGEIVSLCARFITLLQSIVAAPDQAVSLLEFLTPEEREQRKRSEDSQRESELKRLKVAKRRAVPLQKSGQESP